ncbi:LAFE_0F18250g1_1 [Lachancea fermentati]|uniref:LAFE_0F18250g1_1 n=1 Tax=Lachancea fermentati TaxID=4955 RepID=A0A1G4MGK7_LACFM|nr:LAFE_0F18250g1_1 [Lachancea fermentati]
MPVSIISKQREYGNFDTHFFSGQDEVGKDGILRISSEYRAKSQYPSFLPTWNPKHKYDHLEFHEYFDPALKADPEFPNLLGKHRPQIARKITPKFGTEINGIQLTELDDNGKDELALLVAQRGVVIFRNQNFASKGPQYVVEYGKYFGRLHIHQTSGAPEGHPELHITFRRPDHSEFERVFGDNITSVKFHTDVSYELQPPSYTFFSVLEGPDGGGDTLFSDSITAYERPSPLFQEFLGKLHVIHSSKEQADRAKQNGGIQRRDPVTHIHPLIRVHPVLKKKSIFVNSAFSRRIVELKKAESDLILKFLYELVDNSLDLQLRAKWEPGTVTIWDNRRAHHSATIDWEEPISRHAFRITPQGERPVEDLKYLNDEKYYPSEATKDI